MHNISFKNHFFGLSAHFKFTSKISYLTNYKELEVNLETMIAKRFGFKYPYDLEIKDIDYRILNSELRDLMNYADYNIDLAYSFTINPWNSRRAEQEFLVRYDKYKKI